MSVCLELIWINSHRLAAWHHAMMKTADADIVRALPLFSGMGEPHFANLIAGGYVQRFPPRLVLAHEGEKPGFLHVLVQGSVELFSFSRLRETTLAILQPPAAFMLAAVVLDQPYLESARTLEDCTVVLIAAEALCDVFGKDAVFARAVVSELALRYRGLVADLKSQRLRPAVERLAHWIVTYHERQGRPGSFKLPIEKKLLASLLHMRAENLSRCFAELAQFGVRVDGTTLTIVDAHALASLASHDRPADDAAADESPSA